MSLKSLFTLKKIKQAEIDILVNKRKSIQEYIETIEKEIKKINQQTTDSYTAYKESGMRLSELFENELNCIRNAYIKYQEQLEYSKKELEKIIDQLQKAFSEVKKFEFLIQSYEMRVREDIAMQEIKEQDDINVVRHVVKK